MRHDWTRAQWGRSPKPISHLPMLLALAWLAAIAACGEESTVGPETVADERPDPLPGKAIVLHVDLLAGEVTMGRRPSGGLGSSMDGPRFALLGDQEIGVTTSNFFRSQVGEFLKNRVRVRFDLALTNVLTGASFVTPTFPEPPPGQMGLLLIPFEITGITGSGVVKPSTDWNGDGSAGSGAPFNFFNDAFCNKRAGSDCYRWEAYASPLGPGATSEARMVGFDVDPEVQSFDVYVVLAADLESVAVAGLQSISAGGDHTCAVTTGADAYCWGSNGSGQLGNGTETQSDTPVLVVGGHAFQSISAGDNHTCGVTTGGDAYCWGSNGNGRLGDGNAGTDSDTPVLVVGGHAFQSTSAGRSHTCGVTTGGDGYCWGSNQDSQLGDGNGGTNSDTPVLVLGGHAFQSISAGRFHTCGVTTGGDGYCWGFGRLGDGTTGTESDTPVLVVGGLAFRSISAGGSHTCGVTTDGDGYCWGDNPDGQLGDGNAPTVSGTPVLVLGEHAFESIGAARDHSCSVTTGGDGYCWGSNGNGQLGDGNAPTGSDTPVLVLGGHDFQSISAWLIHTCGVTNGGDGYCWGENFGGKLGNGISGVEADFPVKVEFP